MASWHKTVVKMTLAPDFAAKTRHGLAKLGLRLANEADIAAGRDVAARTVGPAVATVEALARVQRRTEASCFVYDAPDGVTAGVLAVIPLTAAAWPDLRAGRFDGLEPADELIARPRDPVVAIYGWGMAGTTWRGRAVVMAAAQMICREIHPTLPLYGRAATAGGERTLLKRLGASPVPGPGGLVMTPAWAPARKVA